MNRCDPVAVGSRQGSLVAEINLAAIVHNCRLLRALIPADCKLCVSVKADAYGHGLELVLPALQQADVEMLAVAAMGEAESLRGMGWSRPILLLGSELSLYSSERMGERDAVDTDKALRAQWLVREKISVTVSRLADLAALNSAGEKLSQPASVHFMFDSGMTREGATAQEVQALFQAASQYSFVSIEGLYTHMASADEGEEAPGSGGGRGPLGSGREFTLEQLRVFRELVVSLRARGWAVPPLHAANSAAAIDMPELHLDMIRPGLAVYGCHSSSQMQRRPELRQALRLRSHLSLVKRIAAGAAVGYGRTFIAPEEMDVGIVPVGYADGYDRRLSNRAVMSLGGCLVPVIGRVSMDQVTLDLRPLAAAGRVASPGDEVVVIDDAPESPNNIEALAQLLDTVPHEVMTGLGGRVQRVAV